MPVGVLSEASVLSSPPTPIAATAILSENLPGAWEDGLANGLSIATALSFKADKTLPWKTVRDTISGALQARYLEIAEGSHDWPCEFSSAQHVFLKECKVDFAEDGGYKAGESGVLSAQTELEPVQLQDFADQLPDLLKICARNNTPIKFIVKIEIGAEGDKPEDDAIQEINSVLNNIKQGYRIQ